MWPLARAGITVSVPQLAAHDGDFDTRRNSAWDVRQPLLAATAQK
jgi:hypothetical protein